MTSPEVETAGEEVLSSPPSKIHVTTSIIIPAYNEEENVEKLIEEISTVLDSREMSSYLPCEVILVDDGSIDGTDDKIRLLSDERSFITSVILARNFGQTAALAAGISVSNGEFIVTMDADLQNNPEDIPSLLDKLSEGYDCVSGWRKNRHDPLSKRIPSAIQTYLARLSGPDIHDFGCTLKAYRSKVFDDISLYGEAHRYIPAILHKQGYRITELTVDHRSRAGGKSKYGMSRVIRGFVDLLFHIFWNRYSTRPLHFLGGTGLLILLAGLVIGGHAVLIKYAFGVELLPRTPRLILTVALVLFGFQLMMFGILAEMLTKIFYKQTREFRIKELQQGSAYHD